MRVRVYGSAAAALLLAGALLVAVPRKSEANLGGRAEVRRMEVVWGGGERGLQARFYLGVGPVVRMPVDREDAELVVGMAQTLAAGRGRMFVDLKDGEVVDVILMAGD